MFWLDGECFIFSKSQDLADSITAFIADSPADIQNLPTSHRPGIQQGGDNVSWEPVNPGSVVFIISTSRVYMLNSNDTWVLQPKQGGSQPTPPPSATALSDLTDVQIGTLADGNFLVYDSATSKWTNKDSLNDIQKKELDEPVIIAGHEYDSVEDALQGVTDMFVWQQV